MIFDHESFELDPVPRLIDAAEWERLEAGLAQRARALDAFVADAYGERRIFAEGIVPERVLGGPPTFEALAAELAQQPRVHVIGFDLARRADGEMVVLEDNVRTPSGVAYAVAARAALEEALGSVGLDPRPSESAPDLLGAALRSAAIDGDGEPRIVVVSDGDSSTAWWEHRVLANAIGAHVATLKELETDDGRLWLRRGRNREPVDVLYRRTDDPRLTQPGGSLTPLGEAALEPMRTGSLIVVNSFGAGVADDKLSYAYTEKMIRFYLDEEPIVRAIPTYDPCVPEQREEALERLDELVLKPRFESGGEGVLIVGEADPLETAQARTAIRDRSQELVVQERISLSTLPCLNGEGLEPRRIDLRPFAYASEGGFRIAPAALTRYAPDPETMVVNSTQGGGAKDTWIVD